METIIIEIVGDDREIIERMWQRVDQLIPKEPRPDKGPKPN